MRENRIHNLHYEKFQDGTVKCIEDEIPFEVPEGWEWCRLNSVVDVRDGTHDTPAYVDKGIPLITSKNLIEGGIDYSNVKYISEEDALGINERSGVNVGDILFAMIGTIGNPSMVTEDILISIKNVALFKFSFSDNLNNYFIMHYLDYAQEDMKKRPSGGLQPFVSLNFLRTYLVPIPPVEEQHRIVSILTDSIDSIRNIDILKNELAISLEKAKSKILDLAIHGNLVPQDPNDEPASVLLERIRAEKEELIKQGKIKRDKKESIIFRGDDNSYYEIIDGTTECIDDDIPFEIPDSWEWIHLSDIVQVLNGDRGQNYPAKNKLRNTGIPFVSASNINSGKVVSKDLLCMTEEQYDALGAGKLITGDIVYCIRGSLGKCGIFTMEKGAIASSLVIVRPIINDTIILDYIFYYLHSELSKREIAKYDNGSAQPNLAAKDFMRFLVPFPPLDEQSTICNKLQEIYSCTMQIEKGIL